MSDEFEFEGIPEIPRFRPRHRMRRSLSWPMAGVRRARRAMPPWSPRGWALFVALILSLIVAAVALAAIPGRWRAASAKAEPSPTGTSVVEATVGSVKRVLVLQGLVVREEDENVRAGAAGTVTAIEVKPNDEVKAGDTLATITLPPPKPVPSPVAPSPSLTPSPTSSTTATSSSSPSPTASASPSPSPPPPPILEVKAISAPVDGQVESVNGVLGQQVKIGRILFVLHPNRFDVIAPVPPSLLYQFFLPPSAIQASIDRGPPSFECEFLSIGDNLDVSGAQSLLQQDADLRCSVPSSLTVFPGIRVRLDVTTAEADNAVILPRRVIQDIHDGRGVVWVVEKGHAPVQRTVALGISDGKVFEITGGLQAGERVLDPGT